MTHRQASKLLAQVHKLFEAWAKDHDEAVKWELPRLFALAHEIDPTLWTNVRGEDQG